MKDISRLLATLYETYYNIDNVKVPISLQFVIVRLPIWEYMYGMNKEKSFLVTRRRLFK